MSRCSAQSEHRTMAQPICELMWIHQLLSEIGLAITVPMKLWCENYIVVHIALEVFREKTKHIEVDCHFIHEKIQQNLISTNHIKTRES